MKLMIVGDLSGQFMEASKLASDAGARVFHTPDISSAMHSLRSGKGADLIMLDINLNIASLTDSLTKEKFSIPVIACGVGVDKEKAVLAIKAGAKEYLPLPPDKDLIAAVLHMVSGIDEDDPVYISSAFEEVINTAKHIAPTRASVLITGETGTGKEIISRFIHNHSSRTRSNFVAVNCAAIPDNLLESELFGHEKGAFTGAIARRCGKFEEANGGTILLDEISEMDIKLQSKLLRVIQEREVIRIGGNQRIPLDVRIITTSNRDLQHEIAVGTFREDLFYRLNVIHMELPSLRERKKDIAALATYFIAKYAKLNGLEPKSLSNDALDKLMQHEWPGNVRELENVMHRSVILARDNVISAEDVKIIKPVQHDDGNIEKKAVLGIIDHADGDYSKAAMILGVSINVLKKKLEQYKNAS